MIGCLTNNATVLNKYLISSLKNLKTDKETIFEIRFNEVSMAIGLNKIIDKAIEQKVDYLFLLHHDIEIIEQSLFKVCEEILDKFVNVGIVGAIGGKHLTSMAWWESKEKYGRIYWDKFDFDQSPDFKKIFSEVDVLDGCFLAIKRDLFYKLKFNERIPHFHGYDFDYCLQARNLGYKSVALPLEIRHYADLGFKSEKEFLFYETLRRNLFNSGNYQSK